MAAGDNYIAESIEMWLYKGDGREEKMCKSFQSRQFQTTLAAQLDMNKRLTVGGFYAALGTRGDYFIVKVPLTGAADAAAVAASEVNKFYAELVDIMNVPADVQLSKANGGYGRLSPFDSPVLKVTPEMQKGISKEKLNVTNTVTASGTTTYVTQTVGGVSDERFQTKFTDDIEGVPGTASTEFYFRIKPTSSNVLALRPDSSVWVLYPAIATPFAEVVD